MPVFNFEKMTRRDLPVPVSATDTESRGVIIRWLDQIAEARMQRDARAFSRMQHRKTHDDDPVPDRNR